MSGEGSNISDSDRPQMQLVRVWDLPTRAFHWLLAASLAGSWLTAEIGYDWFQMHFYLGYLALGLVAFRLIWGFMGSTYARFAHFLHGPAMIARYLRGEEDWRYRIGHNPVGGWAIVLLLALVGVQAASGLFISDDILYAGPYNGIVSSNLADRLNWFHHTSFNLLLAATGLHIAAALWYNVVLKRPLIQAIWHGHRPLDRQTFRPVEPVDTLWLRGTIVALIVACAIAALIYFAPPPTDYFY